MSSFIKIGPVALKLWVVENRPSPLLWPLVYTTACTTVQAVKKCVLKRCIPNSRASTHLVGHSRISCSSLIWLHCVGDPDSKGSNTRAKHWITRGHICSGSWIREVCNLGWDDLSWVIAAPQMFVNKIRLEDSPMAFRCLELWYGDRVSARHLANIFTSLSSSLADLGYRFNLTYFSQQPFAQQRHLIAAASTSRDLLSTPLVTTPLRW